MRRVEFIMGLPVTVDIPNCDSTSVFQAVFTRFHEIDERFSTYKKLSEVSKYSRGELKENELSNELKFVINECKKAEKSTDGYFSAWADGAFDPSGYVKGWAIAQAGEIIEKNGYKTYCISAGGDILARSDSEKVWQIAIQDPHDPSKILDLSSILDEGRLNLPARLQIPSGAVGNRIAEHRDFAAGLSISNGAVCTSGNYERGAHIIDPITKKPADELLSVTITGPDIIKADILATACFAMGSKAISFMKSQSDYRTLIIDKKHLK